MCISHLMLPIWICTFERLYVSRECVSIYLNKSKRSNKKSNQERNFFQVWITVFEFILNCERFPENICNGRAMQIENADSSGRLLLFNFASCMCSTVRAISPNLSCFRTLNIQHPSDLKFYFDYRQKWIFTSRFWRSLFAIRKKRNLVKNQNKSHRVFNICFCIIKWNKKNT